MCVIGVLASDSLRGVCFGEEMERGGGGRFVCQQWETVDGLIAGMPCCSPVIGFLARERGC